ncbi:ArnT family glycosyltransferase [Candidatus Colwellia aromaticivorans]|uniref:ArnT family glycosyltransferase n=1 Tax=Candidatus Colwellia aromaticivorans TaxID=2267621 RepID=UPI001444953B|nr:glycosyltransferase family 39 protein [Candidatus Colwellia aromaticivorans]
MPKGGAPLYLDKKLFGVIILAILYRLVFYTGIFGSDEMTYNGAALAFLNGTNDQASYIGALRYGINIPVAVFFLIFGVNEWSANSWSFICSILEVALVYIFALRVFGVRTALFAGVIIATTPLHVHYAGRMMGDAVLAFFLSLSIFLFYFGEKHESGKLFFGNGLAHGFIWFVKSGVAVLATPIIVLYALATKSFSNKWIWIIIGGLTVFCLHLLLMWKIHNDPLYLFDAITNSMNKLSNSDTTTPPIFYLKLMFIDLRHIWLLGLMASLGVVLLYKQKLLAQKQVKLIVIWFVFMLFILSALPLKQANYTLIFVAPMSILAGFFLSKQSRSYFRFTLFIWLSGATLLSGLEQQSIRNFVANSNGIAEFSQENPSQPIYVNQRNKSVMLSMTFINNNLKRPQHVIVFDDLLEESDSIGNIPLDAYLIFDNETVKKPFKVVKNRFMSAGYQLAYIEDIEPKGYGIGLFFIKAIYQVSKLILPSSMETKVLPFIKSYEEPKRAQIFKISRLASKL